MRVNPEMVALARVSRGLSLKDVAGHLGITSATLSRYEAGRFPVPEASVDALVEFLDYPVSFFQQDTAPGPGFGPDVIYHRRQLSVLARLLSRAYALAALRRMEAVKLAAVFGLPEVPRYPSELYDDPGKAARTLKAKWSVPMGPVFNMTRLLETNGVVVYRHDFGSGRIDGFTHLRGSGPPVIHMNSALRPDRWRWTLAHELGHLVMHGDFPGGAEEVEKQADLFAAEFLMPGFEIGPELADLDESALVRLKGEWRVSMPSLVRRAWDLGLVTGYRRRTLMSWLSKSGSGSRDWEDLDSPVEVPPLPGRMVLRCVAERGFSREEMLDFLCIGERDFGSYYGAGMVAPEGGC